MSAPLLVADSGPLIALARLGLLSLPSRIFGDAWVTSSVWDEVTRSPRAAELAQLAAAREEGLLRVVEDPAALPDTLADPRLGIGERSALALALAERAAVLIDERLGRAVATAAGLDVVGTLGLLVRAKQDGLIPRLRPVVESLVASGYFLARPLVEQALAAVGE